LGFRDSGFRNWDLPVVKHMRSVNKRLTAQFRAEILNILYGPGA
jgi:hypothetical protein